MAIHLRRPANRASWFSLRPWSVLAMLGCAAAVLLLGPQHFDAHAAQWLVIILAASMLFAWMNWKLSGHRDVVANLALVLATGVLSWWLLSAPPIDRAAASGSVDSVRQRVADDVSVAGEKLTTAIRGRRGE